jgi:hypothetical protein
MLFLPTSGLILSGELDSTTETAAAKAFWFVPGLLMQQPLHLPVQLPLREPMREPARSLLQLRS